MKTIINSARLSLGDRGSIHGLFIKFSSSTNVMLDDLFSVELDKVRYFKVVTIDATRLLDNGSHTTYPNLNAEAVEIGYNKSTNIDLREVIGKFATLVTDKEIIKKINEESLWC